MATDNTNVMGQGGSYTIHPETHDLVLQERTKQPGEIIADEATKAVATVDTTESAVVETAVKKSTKDK